MFKKKKTYLVPFLGFILLSIIGAILLYLPICNKQDITFLDSLYTSVSTVTGTALLKSPIVEQFNLIGQIIIAILMEIGAVGFIVFISYIWSKRNKKMQISDLVMVNENTSGDNNYNLVKEHSVFVINFVLRIQIIGAILLSIRFVPEYGILKGIWYGIFHSISAFTNVGYDILGTNSLCNYSKDYYLLTIIFILMLLGSIGIFAIEDIKNNKSRKFKKLKLQTKIILVYSFALIVIPAILLKIFEDNISLFNSLFMSLTARSAGFSSINIESFSNASKLLLMLLMFIGGSPSSTAGGIKVIITAIIISTVVSTFRGRSNTIIFWKKIPAQTVRKSFAVFMSFMSLAILAAIMLAHTNNTVGLLEVLFESISALSNAGLTLVTAPTSSIIGDLILLELMLIGRIGPIAMIMVFVPDEPIDKLVEYPTENVNL